MDTTDKPKETKKIRLDWWPDVSDEQGRRDCRNAGAAAAGWICVSYIFVGWLRSKGIYLLGEGAEQFEATVALYIGGFSAALAAFFGWRIWKKWGHISAIIVLIWVVSEVLLKLMFAQWKGIMISLAMTWAAILGVRGTLAEKRIRKAAT